MNASIDLEGIQSFVAVLDQGGFTQAGRLLGVPRSTVSRRVARLEANTGVTLLHRTTRTVQATEAGQRFYDEVTGLVQGLQTATRSLGDTGDAPRGHLRISALADMAPTLLSRLIVDYQRRYPEVKVSVSTTDRTVDLLREGIDVAFRAAAELPDVDHLRARRVLRIGASMYASTAYVEAHGVPCDPGELANHPFVGFTPAGQHISEVALARVSDPEVLVTVPTVGRFETDSLYQLREVVLAGAGVGFIPDWFVIDDLASGRVVKVLPEWIIPGGWLWMLWPASRFTPARIRTFLDHVSGWNDGVWAQTGARASSVDG